MAASLQMEIVLKRSSGQLWLRPPSRRASRGRYLLKVLLGHGSLDMTMRYSRIDDSTLAQGYLAAMEYVNGR